MKFGPRDICSISIPKPTDQTDCTVKIMWAELRKSWKCGTRWQNCGYCPITNNDLVKMTSCGCQEGNRACIPKVSSNSIHTVTPQIHPKNSNFTIFRPRLLQLWYTEFLTNISMDVPTVFNNTYTIVMMPDDQNLNENIMQKSLICQPMFNGILWEIFKRRHGTVGQPQKEK